MEHVFVSYVRDNEAEVRRLVDALRGAGVEVWFDRDSLQAGSRWQDAIARSIHDGAFYIACYSAEFAARAQTYMHEELALARAMLHEPVAATRNWCLPVLVGGGSAAEAGLANDPDFGTLHSVDFHSDPLEALRHILAVVSPERSMGRCLNVLPSASAVPLPGDALLALDFGTSNSLLALADPEHGWNPVRDAEGRIYFPTAITFAENWDYWVGQEAAAAAYRRPERCVTGMKRLLASGGEARIAHKRFDSVTLASLVLRHMRDCAARQFGRSVTDVVMAAPAEYTSAQVIALLRACELAGLRVRRFVPEPNAAALLAAQWLDKRPDLLDRTSVAPSAVVLIIDIGGGTTDVSALEVAWFDGEWQFEVLSTRGDNELGGMDYDEALRSHLRAALMSQPESSELIWAPSDEARLLDQARLAKERLAVAHTATITLPDVQTREGELCTVQLELDRPTALKAVEPVDARLRQKVEAAMADLERDFELRQRHGDPKCLAGVLLAGQGSKLWTVAEYLHRRFEHISIESGFQESAVCRGLVLQSAVLRGQRADMLLLDVTTFAVGMRYLRRIERLGEESIYRVDPAPERNPHVAELIRVDTTIPTKISQSFSTNGPGELSFDVVELNRTGELVGVLASLRLPLAPGRCELTVDVDIWADRRMRFQLLDERHHPLTSAELRLSSE